MTLLEESPKELFGRAVLPAPVRALLNRPHGALASSKKVGSSAESSQQHTNKAQIIELTTIHSLTWLVIANAIGVLLAGLLVAPSLGDYLGSLGFGRWVPLHLDLQLYGWCSLPLVAFLFHLYLPDLDAQPSGSGLGPRIALSAWSGALLFASISLLGGENSGKLFLEWKGASRVLFPASLLFLALVLLHGYLARLKQDRSNLRSTLLSSLLLGSLFPVPFVLYWASSPTVYPPYNPSSGGATGTSLLGSSLGIILLFCLIPVLGRAERRTQDRRVALTMLALAVHFLLFASLDHGLVSNHDSIQIFALSSLIVWWPLLVRYYRGFLWPNSSARWLLAFGAWSAVLLVTAIVTFLPGVLTHWKFTNALVAHAHLAMAGMITSFNVSLLALINRNTRLRHIFDLRSGFWMWQTGCAAFVLALLILGTLEGVDPGRLFRPDTATNVLYGVRLLAGVAMFAASFLWLRAGVRSRMPATALNTTPTTLAAKQL